MKHAWMVGRLAGLALAVVACGGCDELLGGKERKEKPTAEPARTGAKPTGEIVKGAGPGATGGGAARGAPAPGGTGRYGNAGLTFIADNCGKPYVIAANAPSSKGAGYHWPWTRQAVYAHPEFKPISMEPSAVGEVYFELIDAAQGFVLVARCWDGGTCNRLAAMLKSVVRSSRPQLFCGSVPVQGAKSPAFLVPVDGYWLPAPDDVIAQCARLAACQIAADPTTPGDPGLECQRAPSGFKLACAARSSCAEVQACAGR